MPDAVCLSERAVFLKDVLAQTEWGEVRRVLSQTCPDERQLDRLEGAYRTLRSTVPAVSGMCLQAQVDADVPGVHVFGSNGEPFAGQDGIALEQRVPARFNLSAVEWSEWLGMCVAETFRQHHAPDEIIAYCLWEMTFLGFTPNEIRRRVKQSCADTEE
jgi:hypothetical protein